MVNKICACKSTFTCLGPVNLIGCKTKTGRHKQTSTSCKGRNWKESPCLFPKSICSVLPSSWPLADNIISLPPRHNHVEYYLEFPDGKSEAWAFSIVLLEDAQLQNAGELCALSTILPMTRKLGVPD